MPVEAPLSMTGLPEVEAQARLAADGPNQLPRAANRGFPRIVLDTFREPMFGLLLGAGFVYLLLGSSGEALVLLGFATISVTIAVIQESRSERVLEALRDLTSPRALVIRDGIRKRIAGRDVVRGDMIVLGEGDRVPADAILRAGQDIQIDESLLSGEAVPVCKSATLDTPTFQRPGGDNLPFVFSGTLVVRGQGVAQVYATGPRSEIGKIGLALSTLETRASPLQRQTRRLVRVLAGLGLGISALAAVLFALFRGSWLDGLLGGIALAMSMLPEEFPLVLTVFMVMGAWRISRARVLTRRASAIETLGAATILCSDKTGTLTQNRMSVAELWNGEISFRTGETASAVPDELHPLLEFAILASAVEPVDPMERAFRDLAQRDPGTTEHIHPDWELIYGYGLRPDLLAMSQVWKRPRDDSHTVAAKGAPEAIVDLCHLDPENRAKVMARATEMASRGMRILGVAQSILPGANLPVSQHDFPFAFMGLIGLADPLRANAAAAVRECRSAGIKVAMITGDHPATARAVAQDAGIDAARVMTGGEISEASDAQLTEEVKATRVFARILPEQKLRLVNAFKANGEVVAMTGDGVNDAPALKAAHIGVAMGARGTDVAREAASIVLLDDDFNAIVRTVRLGRRIYDNLCKAMGYILAIHVVIAGVALLPLLLDWPIILGPVHIAFLQMVIDPVCSIVFEAEPEEDDVMRRPPREPRGALLPNALVVWGVIQGMVVFALIITLLIVMRQEHMSERELRALTFVALVAANFALIFVNRSFGASFLATVGATNHALWIVLLVASALLGAIFAWSPARHLFDFGLFPIADLIWCCSGGIVLVILLDGLKLLWRKRLAS